ncbi:hypothetical protein KFK14_00445 [Sphingobium phenoxybenzoativorans]|uniref:Uncharacterized protein n=1 Tax=Sphingobium phenoxybenzoativorans TaxID=1592790 RepID=A0A975K737_9SPHN|nr:hypothetical protein [Sphingobium phenoxybenzoativorans]QUT06016.1 hypothetical protein KFK14_00445 [Sphingobium phenoxybenzoativorans]
MKAKVGQIEVEGTPDEVVAFIRRLNSSVEALVTGRDLLSVPILRNAVPVGTFVSEEVAFQILKRRALSSEQRLLLKLLRENGSNWTTAKNIQAALKYSRSQLGGMLGAFGKRVNSSPGYVDGQSFFEQEWDYENDCHKYRLPGQVLAAVKRAGI